MNSRSSSTVFNVCFGGGAPATAAWSLPIPVLAGETNEAIFEGLVELPQRKGFRLFERDGLLVGAIDVPAEVDLTAQSQRIYHTLLQIAEGRRLARVWNYVPSINEPDAAGLENYRAFCLGRSHAFEENLGAVYHGHLPAASAVGGVEGRLSVIFAATRTVPAHVENPDQVPAYEYPLEHGPRAPSFARATRVDEAGCRYVFISGTASIKGHATVAVGDLTGQIACTLDNLRIVSRGCGLGERFGAAGEWTRYFKVYLRHAADYPAAAALLDGVLFTGTDHVTWLLSDICRAALLIEIEATLVAAAV
ncbi:MAG: hypothetical protein WC205_03915 [Opitutaceae bacterium]|jgi:enamine deaminase RidA (YjgF/YER057c/UK114 family)